MTISATPRMGLTQWSAETDSPSRSQFETSFGLIDSLAAIFGQGTDAAKPTPGTQGRLYRATDSAILYYDDGSNLDRINGALPTATSGSPLASPSTGQSEFDTDTNTTSVWNGSEWVHSPFRMYATGAALDGSAPAASKGGFLIQAGTVVVTTNGAGGWGISYWTAFPNGLLAVSVGNGDYAAAANVLVLPAGNAENRSGVEGLATVANTGGGFANSLLRINFIAIGF